MKNKSPDKRTGAESKVLRTKRTHTADEHSQAVALFYDGDSAPTVTATGMDEVAEAIIAWAKENSVPLHEDPDLITLLSQLELGDEIPPPLYRVVAEVIAFAYLATGKTPEGFEDEKPQNDE